MKLRIVAVTVASILMGGIATLPAETLRVPQKFKTIQAAIDAAMSGDVVLVQAGTYTERIRFKENIAVRSAGNDEAGELGLKRAEATVIDGTGGATDAAGVSMAEGATLDGFTITNVGRYDDDQWNEHFKTQGENQPYEHIGAPGIAGIAIAGVTCSVKNNIVHHVGYTGIALMGVAGKRCSPHVFQNVCYRNMGGGIGAMKKSTGIIESNVCFENFFAGIGHDNASPIVINNMCYGNVRAGIGISEGSSPIVRGNKCYHNRRAGIGVRTGQKTQPIVVDNDCYENDMAGIGSREKASPIINRNRCFKNKLAGIGSRTGSSAVIINNESYENEKVGIGQMSEANTVLIGNHCHDNKLAGIGFDKCEKGQSIVVGNRVINNKLVAVGVNPGWKVTLCENDLSREGGLPPIAMIFAGSQATFVNNTIRGGGVAGIRAEGTVRAMSNAFIGTSLRKVGPPNFGIWGLKGSQLILSNNNFRSWRHALFAQGSAVSVVKNNIREFHRTAIVVKSPSEAPIVVANSAATKNRADQVVDIEDKSGTVEANRLLPTTD